MISSFHSDFHHIYINSFFHPPKFNIEPKNMEGSKKYNTYTKRRPFSGSGGVLEPCVVHPEHALQNLGRNCLSFVKRNQTTRFAPENRPKPNRKVVFQTSIFRGYVSFREGVVDRHGKCGDNESSSSCSTIGYRVFCHSIIRMFCLFP